MKLDQLVSRKPLLLRQFAFPPEAKTEDRMVVHAKYLSSSLFEEKKEAVKVKVVGAGAKRSSSEPTMSEFRKAMAEDVLVHTILRIEGVTVRKLARLIPINIEAVRDQGGDLDSTIDMDLSNKSNVEATESVVSLITESPEFFDWLMAVVTNIANFQDSDWADQLGNSRRGPATSSGPPSEISPATA